MPLDFGMASWIGRLNINALNIDSIEQFAYPESFVSANGGIILATFDALMIPLSLLCSKFVRLFQQQHQAKITSHQCSVCVVIWE